MFSSTNLFHSNEADLKMIAELGVYAPGIKQRFNPRRKFKAAIAATISIVRMQKLSAEWSKTRKLREGLSKAKGEVLKRRKGSTCA